MTRTEPRIELWMDLLGALKPSVGALLIGAGSGTGEWIGRLQRWGVPHVALVEAGEAQFQQLQHSVAPREGWHLHRQVVACHAEFVDYHQASHAAESGLLDPQTLRGLWPHLKTRQTQSRQAVTVATLLQDSTEALDWLVVDCLPALPIIEGAGERLEGVDVIAARVVLDDTLSTCAAAGLLPLSSWLGQRGFRCIAAEPGRHPAVGHALFVRDAPAMVRTLRNELACSVARALDHQQRLAQDRAAAQMLADGRQQEIERLRQAAVQALASSSRQAEEHAARMAQLEQARAGAEQLALERRQEVERLRQAAAQAQAAAENLAVERRQEVEQLRQSVAHADAAAKQQAERHSAQLSQLTQARDAAATLAAGRQDRIDRLQQAETAMKVMADDRAAQLLQVESARAAADKLVASLQKKSEPPVRANGDADIDDLINDLAVYFAERSITYVDVGSFVGEVFLKFQRSKAIKVREAHLYEPNPASYKLLTENIRDCKVPSLHAYNLAVGITPGTLHFNAAQSMTKVIDSQAAQRPISNTFSAESVTLDDQAKFFTDQKINVLKIDVEGKELEVLTGAGELLRSQRIDVVYIEVGFNKGGTQQTYFSDIDLFMQNTGYRVFRIYEQMNEWVQDSPWLRRCNFAYMSEDFARSNPSKLVRKLEAMREELERLTARAACDA